MHVNSNEPFVLITCLPVSEFAMKPSMMKRDIGSKFLPVKINGFSVSDHVRTGIHCFIGMMNILCIYLGKSLL